MLDVANNVANFTTMKWHQKVVNCSLYKFQGYIVGNTDMYPRRM